MMAYYSHIVNIICEESVQYSLVSHLSADLRRQGITVLVDSISAFWEGTSRDIPFYDYYTIPEINSFPGDQNQAVYVLVISNTVGSKGPYRIPKFIDVIKRQSKNGHAVFYGVDPSSRLYGWFNGRLEIERMQSYYQQRNLLLTDSELVEGIVRDVYEKVYRAERVGIYSRLMEIENLLYKQPWGIRSIGLWGMPGIGKTTLAKAAFAHMSDDYDASCFIENFDQAFHTEGLHRLFQQKFGNILKEKSSYIMRPSFHNKSILVVLDDVHDSLAAESFLGRLDWVGLGSLVIMTSIDKQVFAFCQINQIYEVQGLNEHEALQLFSQHAFGKEMPNIDKQVSSFWQTNQIYRLRTLNEENAIRKDFERGVLEQNDTELSRKVIEYTNGNPLALNIYGRELKGKKAEMEAAFLELKQCPPQKIQDVLKKAYTALDDNEKNIVLDIAFFFKGENVNYVAQLLEGCCYFPRVGIDVLVDKCVLTISENTVQMNSLVQDFCLNGEIESCTRMREPYNIRYLLEDDELKASGESSATPKCGLVAEDIESINLDTLNLKFDVKHDAFKNMVNLKFLKICSSCSKYVPGLNFPKGLDSLPCGLRLLHWENYPLQSVPQDFDLDKLVEICMPYSQLQTFRWTGTKNLKMLKRIRLCHSQELVEFDLPLNAQNIELIDLQGCTRLQSFPDTSDLQHLRVVNLSGCIEMKRFRGAPPNIEELHLQGTRIREMPVFFVAHSDKF